MKIKLKPPYSNDREMGYLVVNPEWRRTVILYNSCKDRSSTQYARYKLWVKLWRYLTDEETVDHIDWDKTNDSIKNLQIMSLKDNFLKSAYKWKLVWACYICKQTFYRNRHLSKKNKMLLNKWLLCCSVKCWNKKKSETLLNKKK